MNYIFVIKIRRVIDLLLCPCSRIDVTILLFYKQFDMLYVVFSFSNYLNAYFWNNLIIKIGEKRKNRNVVGFRVLVDPWSRVVVPTGTRGPPPGPRLRGHVGSSWFRAVTDPRLEGEGSSRALVVPGGHLVLEALTAGN